MKESNIGLQQRIVNVSFHVDVGLLSVQFVASDFSFAATRRLDQTAEIVETVWVTRNTAVGCEWKLSSGFWSVSCYLQSKRMRFVLDFKPGASQPAERHRQCSVVRSVNG